MVTITYKVGSLSTECSFPFEKEISSEGVAAAIRECQEVFERIYLTYTPVVSSVAKEEEQVFEPSPVKQTKKTKDTEVTHESHKCDGGCNGWEA